MTTRRNFIRTAALGAGAAALSPSVGRAGDYSRADKASRRYTTGVADYTFRHFDIPTSIAMMQSLDVHALSVKDFHLPLDSTPEKIGEVIGEYKAAGIDVYGVGVIYMKSKVQVDQAFSYARNAGVSLIVGVPEYDLLDYTEQKVKEYSIRVAIHNHGPQDKLYPGPREVYERIRNRDKRLGICLDIGHSLRAGEDPAAAVLKYHERLYDMHIKDVTKAENDGQAIQIGRGVLDFQALVKALRQVKYTGHCSIEFEENMKNKEDELPAIAESLGYFKGVSQSIS